MPPARNELPRRESPDGAALLTMLPPVKYQYAGGATGGGGVVFPLRI
jgi:hypothetical protein